MGMQTSEKMQSVDQKPQEKLPYTQPQLVRHGAVEELTQLQRIGSSQQFA